jgi:hypothetical protein
VQLGWGGLRYPEGFAFRSVDVLGGGVDDINYLIILDFMMI